MSGRDQQFGLLNHKHFVPGHCKFYPQFVQLCNWSNTLQLRLGIHPEASNTNKQLVNSVSDAVSITDGPDIIHYSPPQHLTSVSFCFIM